MSRRVVVTGMAALTPLGNDWPSIARALRAMQSAVEVREDWDQVSGLQTRLAAPVADFQKPAHYTRKKVRTMGRVSLMSAIATEWALDQAGLLNDPIIASGKTGISYGSTSGSPTALNFFVTQVGVNKTLEGITAASFIKGMSHTCAANLAQFFQVRGRIVPTTCACTAGSQGIGYAYEAIKYGLQDVMIAGGAEELHVFGAAVFDIMYATSTMNQHPEKSPRPFDVARDGLVIGEGAGTLILESLEHAQARGATILGEIAGFSTNCDGAHVVNPSSEGMAAVMASALEDAGVSADQIDYVNAHATATPVGDIAETRATEACFQRQVPISSLKSYMGHTLGACGAIEAMICLHLLEEGWLPPTINLDQIDPECANLDYLTEIREHENQYIMSNNFAFGGVNTSMVLKRFSR